MIKWEYKVRKSLTIFSEDVLDSFGEQGYELISLIETESWFLYTFKRPKSE